MESQPLFIVGSPRSGTTFLVHVLNQHPSIQITNETRIFVLLKKMLDEDARNPWLLEKPYQSRFATHARRRAGAWVEGFYRDELGITAPVWGDKHPHYADPLVLGDRPIPGTTSAHGSCLRLIRQCLPTAKFVHIHRDPRDVAFSILQKKWKATLADAVDVWRRHVEEIDGFFREIGPEAHRTIAYADLLTDPEPVADEILRFVGLTGSAQIVDFVRRQRVDPTPFSLPMTNLLGPRHQPLSEATGIAVLSRAGRCAGELGYGTGGER